MSAALLLAATLAADSALYSGPNADQIARMNRTLHRAHEVRVVCGLYEPLAMYVTRPHALPSGLDYEVPVYRLQPWVRNAGHRDLTPKNPRPMPWSRIEEAQWRHGGTRTGILVGTLAGAVILAGVIATVNGSHSDVGPAVPSVALGAVAGGALAGVIASSLAARTEVIYRARHPFEY